ncbi:MAG: ice-binding family protein, partial [Kiritimatiellae bacterium]|nr:ice-binding family protein [Kiritimatiellia bacterium]
MKFPIFNSSYSGIGISRWMHLLILGSALLVPSAKAGHPEDPINLNSAGDFVILAKSGITNVPDSDITGDMGVSPIDSTAITGFALIMDSSNEFSTSAQVTGEIYASDYSPPPPPKMTTAISDMETAYTVAAGRTDPDTTNLGGGEIGGLTISPGLHKWGTGVGISNNVTLDAGGVPDAVFIFQIEGDLNVSSGQSVILAGGAQAKNIFWQVAGGSGAVIGTTAHFEGVLLTATKIDLLTNATFNGKLLAQTAVNLDQNIIVDSEQINQYTLIYEASLGGSILGDSPQFVMEGEDGTQVEANAEPGFVFVEWSDGSIDNPRTDLNVQEDITVEAQFVTEYTLTYTAGLGGNISGVSPQTVAEGDDGTQVEANAEPGFVFVEWSDGSIDNPRTDLNVQEDITVEAQFVEILPNQFVLTYTAGPGGSVSGVSPQIVDQGEDGTEVTAEAAPGFVFVEWLGTHPSNDNPRTDTDVQEDITVEAQFEAVTYTLTYTAGIGGSINGVSPQIVNEGDDGPEVTAEAAPGCVFV